VLPSTNASSLHPGFSVHERLAVRRLAPGARLSWGLVYLLSAAAGLTVANIYYNQPLLAGLEKSFHASPSSVGRLAVATQLGYACGLLLLVPLGDVMERRRLIIGSALGTSLVLLVVTLSPMLPFMIVVSFFLGLIAITPQLIVPYAATLAEPKNRGQIVGIVMGGLFIGILFSRVAGGFLGDLLGWRAVFGLGAALTFLLAITLLFLLPAQRPTSRLSYPQLLTSLFPLLVHEPVLRRHAFMGALGFGAFSAFWTTLSFYLASRPEHYGGEAVGLFGLVAIIGAAIAPLAGWLSDRFSARLVNGTSLLVIVLSFAMMMRADASLLWLMAGVFLMDAGVQSNQISNQTRIYTLAPELRNRITSVYMFFYFLGGAIGSAVGAEAWMQGGWPGVCYAGAFMAAIATLPLLWRPSERTAGTQSA
jgi:predicted MFS family arabinose efflux permease